ncbi:hypothetical protein G1K73_11695 [Tenacibaculum finnmarkense]|uniref:hypothetical protein n=1 Tax=Tenacibaculum finnmarkense TaxID=2781243 RepID=UPI001EFAF512|nr:hypothetical protein [Tenacibaculum finnmarkense]MCG8894405.1 hypothetical protein [Tenacibaculum finnmarkense]
MIQHIKFNRGLFISSSCKNKKEASIVLSNKKTGDWVLVKSAKIGKWENNTEYLHTQEELKNVFKKTFFNFSKDLILINEPYCSGSNILTTEPLNQFLNGTNEYVKMTKTFFKDEFGLVEKRFKGVYKTLCEPPFHKIFDFGDKLLVRENGTYYYLFEKQKEIKSVKTKGYNCKDIEIENIYEEPLYKTCECDYDFSKCYSLFYNDLEDYYKKKLLKNLPKEDIKPSSGFTGTYYKFYKKDSLEITIQEDGGASSYLFKKVKGKTIIECYADAP